MAPLAVSAGKRRGTKRQRQNDRACKQGEPRPKHHKDIEVATDLKLLDVVLQLSQNHVVAVSERHRVDGTQGNLGKRQWRGYRRRLYAVVVPTCAICGCRVALPPLRHLLKREVQLLSVAAATQISWVMGIPAHTHARIVVAFIYSICRVVDLGEVAHSVCVCDHAVKCVHACMRACMHAQCPASHQSINQASRKRTKEGQSCVVLLHMKRQSPERT